MRLVTQIAFCPSSGPAAGSFGLYCAQLSGVPSHVLERAMHIMSLQQKGRHISTVDCPVQRARDRKSLDIVKGLAELESSAASRIFEYFQDVASL